MTKRNDVEVAEVVGKLDEVWTFAIQETASRKREDTLRELQYHVRAARAIARRLLVEVSERELGYDVEDVVDERENNG